MPEGRQQGNADAAVPVAPGRWPLRRRVGALSAVCVLGAVASILIAYHVSLSPPGLQPRAVTFAVAKAEVLVDTPTSQLIDSRQDFYLLLPPNVALTDALYLQTAGAVQAAATAAGIPGQEVSASGPFTDLINLLSAPPKGPALPAVPHVNAAYRLLVDVDGQRPMISLYGQAPTERAAVAIVDSARATLEQHVAALDPAGSVPPGGQRTTIRALGPTTGGVVDPGARPQLMAFIFCLVLVLGASVVFALERRPVKRARRDAALAALDPLADEPADSDDWPHTTRVLPWLMAVFMAMIFLVPIDQMSLPLHLGAESFPDRVLLLVMLGLWIPALAMGSARIRPRLRLTRVHAWVFLFMALCFLSVAANGGQLAIYQEVSPTVKKLLLLLSFVLFFVIASSVLRPREVPRFISLMIGLGVFLAVATIVESKTHYNVFYSLWQKVTPVTLPSELDQLDNIGRLTVDGPTSEPLELAALLAMVIPFTIIAALESTTRRRRLLYVLAATILLAGDIATARKTSVVAPALGVLVLMVYRPRVIIRALLKASVPLFIAVHLIAPGQIGSVVAELLPGHVSSVSTTTVRVARYDAVRPDIMSHLLLGRGFQSYDPVKYRVLDNEYLALLIGVGLIGTLVYVAIFGSVAKVAHGTIRGPDRRRAAVALPGLAAVVIVLVSNALFDVLSFPHVSYLFFFICGMLLTVRERSPVLPPRGARVSDDDRWLDEIGIASGPAQPRRGELEVLVR